MPDTTYGFTYPAATDAVKDGAAAIQALAEDVDRRFGFGTALPTSPAPVDNQEFLLVDSLTAPTWQIPLRYVSALAKWLPIGRPCLRAFTQASSGGTVSTTYVDGTSTPTLTVPVAGTWDVYHRCYLNGVNYGRQSVSYAGAIATDADSTYVYNNSPASTTFAAFTERLTLAKVLAAGAVVKLQHRTNDGGVSISELERLLELRPVLLG